jgi:hypothetical protein
MTMAASLYLVLDPTDRQAQMQLASPGQTLFCPTPSKGNPNDDILEPFPSGIPPASHVSRLCVCEGIRGNESRARVPLCCFASENRDPEGRVGFGLRVAARLRGCRLPREGGCWGKGQGRRAALPYPWFTGQASRAGQGRARYLGFGLGAGQGRDEARERRLANRALQVPASRPAGRSVVGGVALERGLCFGFWGVETRDRGGKLQLWGWVRLGAWLGPGDLREKGKMHGCRRAGGQMPGCVAGAA